MYARRFAKRLRAELSYGTGVSLYFQCQTQLVLLSVRDLTKQELQWRVLPALESAFSLPLFSFSFLWLQPQIPLAAASSLLSDSIASIYPLVCLVHLRGIHRVRQPTRLLSPISWKRPKVHHPMLMHLSFFYNDMCYPANCSTEFHALRRRNAASDSLVGKVGSDEQCDGWISQKIEMILSGPEVLSLASQPNCQRIYFSGRHRCFAEKRRSLASSFRIPITLSQNQ